MQQPDLFTTSPRFDSGVELTPADHARLGAQLQRVLDVMADGKWWTVQALRNAICARTGHFDPEPSLSAQIRNARKAKHGGHLIERKRFGNAWMFRWVRE